MEEEYTPRHMIREPIKADRSGLKRLAEKLPDGIVLSVDLEEAADGQET